MQADRQWRWRTVIQLEHIPDTNWLGAGELTMIKIVSDAQWSGYPINVFLEAMGQLGHSKVM
jgi:hypothetical protein